MRRLLAVALLIAACSPPETTLDIGTSSTTTTTSTTVPEATTTTEPVEFAVSTPAFDDGSVIPAEFTCDGADVSPELNIVGIPEDSLSLVLIVDDPDAPLGTWDHWLEYDVEAGPGSFDIPRNAGAVGVQGINSWNLTGYMGPCPPQGEEHQYFFTVYALNTMLDLPPESDSDQVRQAMEGRIIDSVELTGTYGR